MKMIDRITPRAALEREMNGVQDEIDALETEREEMRLTAAHEALRIIKEGPSRSDERAVTKLHEKRDGLAEKVRLLRLRRREILDELKPVTPAKEAMLQLPMSDELVAAQTKLDRARSKRDGAMRAVRESIGDQRQEREATAKLQVAEDALKAARLAREEPLARYNTLLAEALRPVAGKAARDLRDAAKAFLVALATLREAASLAPSAGAAGVHLGGVASIDGSGCRAAIGQVSRILDWADDAPETAAEDAA